MTERPCEFMNCEVVIKGINEDDFKQKLEQHIREAHFSPAMERDILLRQKQKEIFDALLQSAEKAKNAGMSETFIQGFMTNMGSSQGGEHRISNER